VAHGERYGRGELEARRDLIQQPLRKRVSTGRVLVVEPEVVETKAAAIWV